MRIIFVGIHNKPGKSPLDSTTRTGKIVDIIIHESGLPRGMFLKTNLCNVETMPSSPDDMAFHMRNFTQRIKPKTGDVFVLLGTLVGSSFRQPLGTHVVKVHHPSSFIGTRNRDEYIQSVLLKIWVHVKTAINQ